MTDAGSHNRNWFTPLVVAALLLLPLLYIGSYFAMVTPNRRVQVPIAWGNSTPAMITIPGRENYRFGNEWAARIYWPLEQVDRKLFPQRWERW